MMDYILAKDDITRIRNAVKKYNEAHESKITNFAVMNVAKRNGVDYVIHQIENENEHFIKFLKGI